MEGAWTGYRESQLNGRRMVMLQRLSIFWRDNGHVIEVASLREGENGHVTKFVTLVEGEWSCYSLMEGE